MTHVRYYLPFDPDALDWLPVFEQQQQQVGGSSLAHFPMFMGTPYQRGSSVWGSIARFLLPILKRSGKAVGKELITAAGKTLSDISAGVDVKESLKKHGKESAVRLIDRGAAAAKKKMGGGQARKRIRPVAVVIPQKRRRTTRRRQFLKR